MDERFNRTEQNQEPTNRGSRIARIFSEDFSFNEQPQQQPILNETTFRKPSNPSLVVKNPKTYDDVRVIIDHLKNGEQVIVLVNDLNQNTICRVLDFLSGAVYALNGSIQEIQKNEFCIVPEGNTILINK